MSQNCPGALSATYNSHANPSSASGYNAMQQQTAYSAFDPKEFLQNSNQQWRIDQLVNEINAIFGNSSAFKMPRNAQMTASARAQAKRLLKDQEIAAAEARQEGIDELNAAMRYYAGTNVNTLSRNLRIRSRITRFFYDAQVQFHDWCQAHFAADGKTDLVSRLSEAFNHLLPDIHGVASVYKDALYTQYFRHLKPLAKKTGRNEIELANMMGHYANFLHTPEGNEHLLKTWAAKLQTLKNQLDMLAASPIPDVDAISATSKEHAQYARKIANLMKNIDNPNVTLKDNVTSIGYTNGEAMAGRAKIEQLLGITPDEAFHYCKPLFDAPKQMLNDRINAGQVAPEQLAAFPGYVLYVPMRSTADNSLGSSSDAHYFVPGTYYDTDGMPPGTRPDSAWLTLLNTAYRTSNELGMAKFGTELVAAVRSKKLHESRTAANGDPLPAMVKIIDYDDKVQSALRSKNIAVKNRMERYVQQGIVARIPDENGDYKRQLIVFNENYFDPVTQMSGAQLNKALSAAPQMNSVVGRGMTKITSGYGQLFTRMQPFFAPVNGIRDIGERAVNMTTRDVIAADGTLIKGHTLAPKMLRNVPRAMKMMVEAKLGRNKDPNSEVNTRWNDYQRSGLHIEYTRGMNELRGSLEDVITGATRKQGTIESTLRKAKMGKLYDLVFSYGSIGPQLMRKLDWWNDIFNHVGPYAQYLTYIEAGVDPRRAANTTLEMMNLYKRGEATPFMRALYPFVIPTIASTANLVRTVGVQRDARGIKAIAPRSIALSAALYGMFSMLMEASREDLGEDENGVSRYDGLSFDAITRSIYLSKDEQEVYRLPIAFGLPKFAATAAAGYHRVSRGMMSPEDFTFEFIYSLVRDAMPGNWPEYNMGDNPLAWLTAAFSPSVLSGVVTTTMNVDRYGRTITYARNDEFKAKADQGSITTPRAYHTLVKWLQQTVKMDLSPEELDHFVHAYAAGPAKLVSLTLDSAYEATHSGYEDPVYKTMDPWLQALGATMVLGSADNPARNIFYRELDRLQRRIRDEGIPFTNGSLRGDAYRAWRIEQLTKAGWTAQEISAAMEILGAESRLQSKALEFNKKWKELWKTTDSSQEMKDAFEELAKDKYDIYADALAKAGLI